MSTYGSKLFDNIRLRTGTVTVSKRPLSPHLQVYRLPLAGLISISHRLTGVALALGTLLFTFWLTAAAFAPDIFKLAQRLMGSWFGYIILLGYTFAIFFHMGNGVRHLFWDVGMGYEISSVKRSGISVILFAVIMTSFTWLFIWYRALGET